MKPWPGLMYYDPEFYTYLKLHMADDLLFCYRFLLFIYYHSDYLTIYYNLGLRTTYLVSSCLLLKSFLNQSIFFNYNKYGTGTCYFTSRIILQRKGATGSFEVD